MEKWFVLNTKPKKESQVEKIFTQGGIRFYFPKYLQENKIKPFFPGYGFINFDYPEDYRLIKYTRGVKQIVGNETGPIPIEEAIINQIKEREIDGYIELNKYGEEPELGDEIEVVEGPLKGLKGIFSRKLTDSERVMILLKYISYQGQLVIEKTKLKKVLK